MPLSKEEKGDQMMLKVHFGIEIQKINEEIYQVIVTRRPSVLDQV